MSRKKLKVKFEEENVNPSAKRSQHGRKAKHNGRDPLLDTPGNTRRTKIEHDRRILAHEVDFAPDDDLDFLLGLGKDDDGADFDDFDYNAFGPPRNSREDDDYD